MQSMHALRKITTLKDSAPDESALYMSKARLVYVQFLDFSWTLIV